MEFSLSNSYVKGILCVLSQLQWTARVPNPKEARISLQWLKFRLVFHLTNEGMSEVPVETQEEAVGLCVVWTGRIASF